MKIIMVMAMTMDGKIAKTSEHFPDWTSREDKKYFAKMSKEAGVVMMGEKTFKTFPKALSGRLSVVFTLEKNPPETENVKWVSGEPEKIIEELEGMGYDSAILGGGANLNGSFLKKNLVDEIIVTVEPKIFGDGLSLFSGDFDVKLDFLGMEKLNKDSIVLKYKVVK
jgi:dihydrofolate reductase